MPAQTWATLTVGLVAALGVIITWQQKNNADRRAEWWRRTAWAFERTFSASDTEAVLGWEVLGTLLRSKLATQSDSDLVNVIGEHVVLKSAEPSEGEGDVRGSEGQEGPRRPAS